MKSFITMAMVQALAASQETELECGDKIVKFGVREVEFSRIETEVVNDIATCFFLPDFVQCLTTEAMLDQICSSHHYDPVTHTIDGTGEWCQDRYRALRDFGDLQYFFDHKVKAELMDEACAIEKAAVIDEYNAQVDKRTYLAMMANVEWLTYFQQWIECTDCVNRQDPLLVGGIRGRELWFDSEGNNMGPPRYLKQFELVVPVLVLLQTASSTNPQGQKELLKVEFYLQAIENRHQNGRKSASTNSEAIHDDHFLNPLSKQTSIQIGESVSPTLASRDFSNDWAQHLFGSQHVQS